MHTSGRRVRGIRYGWRLAPLRHQPGHYIGNFLIAHGAPGNIAPPIRGVEVGTAGDDQGAQSLVADQAEISAIGDRARLGSALVAVTVAGSAERVVERLARLRITRRFGRVRRR